MYLSLYLSRGGICARRKAIDLIKAGEVTVNGERIIDPAHQVQEHDTVVYQGRRVVIAQPLYVLLNKPKGVVTSCADERNRNTVVDLVKIKGKNVRLYPVGRLDKDTTGVLLLTNDGQWAQKLAHPKYRVAKTYVATLAAPLTHEAFERLKRGLFLFDGKFKPDRVYYPKAHNKRVVGITIHSGKYRIVRRVFETLGCRVKSLDRLFYGPLSLKRLERGSWRYLTEKEVAALSGEQPAKKPVKSSLRLPKSKK